MGTTCTAALLRDGLLTYGHVGDSRLYLLRGGDYRQPSLRAITCYVQQLVDGGVITPEQAKTHPGRNILTSALGADSGVQADLPGKPPRSRCSLRTSCRFMCTGWPPRNGQRR